METIGFIGGTGPQGRGMALRLGLAGYSVLLGSRSAERAQAAAAALAEAHETLSIGGDANEKICEQADILFVVVPYEGQREILAELRDEIGDCIVVSCVNHMGFDERGPRPLQVSAGSAAEECREVLPEARVVSAFHHISGPRLLHVERPMAGDVLVCGDDAAAKQRIIELVGDVAGLRGLDAGPLRLSGSIEDFTAVLVSLNRRYKFHGHIRIDGLERLEEG